MNEVLQLILINLGLVAPHDAASIMLVETGIARVVAWLGYTERGLDEAVIKARYRIAKVAHLRQIAETGEPLVIRNTENYPGWIDTKQTRWIRAYTGAPIYLSGKLIGFLNLESGFPDAFNDLHARQLQAFANQAGVTIQSLQLYQGMQRRTAELEEYVAERTAELQAVNERLLALGHITNDFLSNVSYELRTPITSIQLYHDLLELNPKKNAVYLERLRKETSRLVDIIDGLSQLSRLNHERLESNLATVELNELVEVSKIHHTPLAESKGLALIFEKDVNLPHLKVAPELISQALSALLINALNYTPVGGRVVIKTQASQFEGKEWVQVCISDNGPGVPLEEQPRLFERFFRGIAGCNSDIPGIGLGLTVAKEIVDWHGGRIEVESQGIPGQGASFHIWLPASASS
ncbi:MAG: GAF domain-containing sensor histidine kinase [Anaerolineales bacterium]|nr:GAF domain-containing sensor histidine kinase [Anaerolineales bacterium]